MRRWVWQMWIGAVCAVAVSGCKTTCPECEKRNAALPCTGDGCAVAKVAPTKPDVAAKPQPKTSESIAANKPRDLVPTTTPTPPSVASTIVAPTIDVPLLLPIPSVPAPDTSARVIAPSVPVVEPTPSIVVPVAQPNAQPDPSAKVKAPIVVQGVTPEPRPVKFERASNYQWLVGEVTYLSAKKEWRLRYTSLGSNDVDLYGGSVTLTGSTETLEALKDGQAVRVEGELLERTPRSAPPYRVSAVKVLD